MGWILAYLIGRSAGRRRPRRPITGTDIAQFRIVAILAIVIVVVLLLSGPAPR